jgi:hypothetical protein
MCFSAAASFIASGVLTAVGVVSLSKCHHPRQRAFAAIPLIFAVQQFIEGWVWLALHDGSRPLELIDLSRAFLFFAMVLWPAWVPFSLLRMEKQPRRRKLLGWTLAAGTAVALYHARSLMVTAPSAVIGGHHVHYAVEYPGHLERFTELLYFVSTVVAVFISSIRRMWILGLAVLVAYLIARHYAIGNVTSVWCYFAALISVVILYLLHQERKAHRTLLVRSVPQ